MKRAVRAITCQRRRRTLKFARAECLQDTPGVHKIPLQRVLVINRAAVRHQGQNKQPLPGGTCALVAEHL